jgi:hypothetical protein
MPPFLQRLWMAMLTRNTGNAPTSDPLALTVAQDGADRLYFRFPRPTIQRNQEQGQPNLYEVPVVLPAMISPERFVVVGLNALGTNAWRPEVFFVWGERHEDLAIIPLALNLDPDFTTRGGQPVALSLDPSDGPAELDLRRVSLGTAQTRIERLLMVIDTLSSSPNAPIDQPTDASLSLRVDLPGSREVLEHRFPATPQDDLITGRPNLYEAPLTFSREQLLPSSISLAIEGDYTWVPRSFFLFGIDTSFVAGGVRPVVPFVHLPTWLLGPLSTDPTRGRLEVRLPLVPLAQVPLAPPLLDFPGLPHPGPVSRP